MITWQNESALPAFFFTATVKSAERATVETLTYASGQKEEAHGLCWNPCLEEKAS